MITIKEEYLDIKIACPGTRKEILVRFIPVELYDYYYNNGYSEIFNKSIKKDAQIFIDFEDLNEPEKPIIKNI